MRFSDRTKNQNSVCVYVSNDYVFQTLNQDEIIEMIY